MCSRSLAQVMVLGKDVEVLDEAAMQKQIQRRLDQEQFQDSGDNAFDASVNAGGSSSATDHHSYQSSCSYGNNSQHSPHGSGYGVVVGGRIVSGTAAGGGNFNYDHDSHNSSM